MKQNLTRDEIAKIESFCADEKMFEAVKKVLFAVIYSNGTVQKGEKLDVTNGAFHLIANASAQGKAVTDEALGQNLRAIFEGVHTVLDGFAQLKTIKNSEKEVASPYNEAI